MGRKKNRTRKNCFATSVAEEGMKMAKSNAGNPSSDHEANRLMSFINENPKANELFGLMATTNDRLQFYFCDGYGMNPSSKEFDDVIKVVGMFGPFMDDKVMSSSNIVGKFLGEVYRELSQGDEGIGADAIGRYVRYLADEPADNENKTQARVAFCKVVTRALPFVTKKAQVINGLPVLLGQEDPTSEGVVAEGFSRDTYSEDLRYALTAYLIVERFYASARSLYIEWVEPEAAPQPTQDQDESPSATYGSSDNTEPVDEDDDDGVNYGALNDESRKEHQDLAAALTKYPFAEVIKLLTISDSTDELFVRISESEKAVGEIDTFINSTPEVKMLRGKLDTLFGGCHINNLSPENTNKIVDELGAAKSLFINQFVHNFGDGLFDQLRHSGLTKLSNSGILTKPSNDSVMKVVEKLTIYREIINAFNKALEICLGASRKSSQLDRFIAAGRALRPLFGR